MTQKEKQLLLKDLCARLPYGVYVHFSNTNIDEILTNIEIDEENINKTRHNEKANHCKVIPYLRPMSSMTSEEKNTFEFFVTCNTSDTLDSISWANIQNLSIVRDSCDFIDWLNEHHFDYRGLIPMDLALEAPEDMYKT